MLTSRTQCTQGAVHYWLSILTRQIVTCLVGASLFGVALVATAANECGSTSTATAAFVKGVATPQTFPPHENVPFAFAITAFSQACRAHGVADFSPVCIEHDKCYDTPGIFKSECDRDAHQAWKRACRAAYPVQVWKWFVPTYAAQEQLCRSECIQMTNIMYRVIKTKGSDAFEAARKEAIGEYNALMLLPLL